MPQASGAYLELVKSNWGLPGLGRRSRILCFQMKEDAMKRGEMGLRLKPSAQEMFLPLLAAIADVAAAVAALTPLPFALFPRFARPPAANATTHASLW